MKELNKRTEFDRQWEEVFREAEMSPPEGLWDKIDSSLSKEEVGYFKKRAFLFKMLAAASIAFALGVGLFSLNYYLNQNTQSTVAEEIGTLDNTVNYEDQSIIAEQEKVENAPESKSSGKQSTENHLSKKQALNSFSGKSVKSEAETTLLISDQKSAIVDDQPIFEGNGTESTEGHTFLSLNSITAIGVNSDISEDNLLQIDHIYRIPIMPRGASKNKKDEEKESGVYLAGLDFSTGVFDPNFQQGNSVFASASSGYSAMADAKVESFNDKLASFNTSSKDFLLVRSAGKENEPQIALSYGANVGFKLTDRVVIQTGLAYRKANTTISTTGYIEEAGSDSKIPIVASHQYRFSNLSSVSRIPETNLKNQYEFASIPLQAGYIVLDKKVNLTLLAGISSEFLLNNQITDESNFLETLNNSSNDASPYKSVYFNGTLGTMLGYSLAENYSLMLQPSYRFSVNSFTKDDFYLNSYPASFMITLGVAYNFR